MIALWRVLFLAASVPLFSAPLQFHSAVWNIAVEPSDLAVSATLPDGRTLIISAPQRDLGEASGLVQDSLGARWLLPARHVSVIVSLKDHTLDIRFETDRRGKFTWPVSARPAPDISYILPKGEGLLLSPRDPVWRTNAWPRHLDTMSDFSLPLWGVMGPGWTITYLLSNPFDNDFSLQDSGGALAFQLEHEFQPNRQKKNSASRSCSARSRPWSPRAFFDSA